MWLVKGIQVSQNYEVLLALPFSDFRSMEHINFLKGVALALCLENMKSAGPGAQFLMQKHYGADASCIIHLPSGLDR